MNEIPTLSGYRSMSTNSLHKNTTSTSRTSRRSELKINQNKIIVLASSFTNCTGINHESLFKKWLFFSRLEKTKTNTKTTSERLRVYKVRNDVRGKIIEVNEVNCTWALFIEELVIKPGKHQRSKQRCQDLCWKVHDPARSFVLRSYTLCMNYVANTFLLVGSTVRSKQLLCFVQDQGQKTEQ